MPSAPSLPPAADVLPDEDAWEPDVWLVGAAWVVVVASVALLLTYPFGRDQAIYAVVGEAIAAGRLPYRDAWDFKPPGIHLVHALAALLPGRSMAAARVLEAAGLLALVLAYRSVGRRCFGLRRVGLVAGALAALVHVQLDFWHTGQPESFAAFLTAFAIALAASEPHRDRRRWVWVAIGGLFALCGMLKPPLGAAGVAVAPFLVRRERRGGIGGARALLPLAWLAAGAALPAIAVYAWLRLGGAWPATAWTFLEFAPGYTALGHSSWSSAELLYYGVADAVAWRSAPLAVGLVAAVALPPIDVRERECVWLVTGVAGLQLAGVALQAKFFPYHYGATLPLLALVGGLGLYKLWRRSLAAGAAGAVGFAAVLVVVATMRVPVLDLPGTFWSRSAARLRWVLGGLTGAERERLDRDLHRAADYSLEETRAAARAVAELTQADDSVFVWGFEPAIYWLSARRPASRFVYDVPQRVSWARERSRRDLLGELERDPPRVIVVQRGDQFWWVTGDQLDSAQALETFPELEARLAADYELKRRVGDFDLHVRVAAR
ncbi:MAG: glycosyltransferase family 39 protein [Polyangiaceae bacterium]|nr:glycosyltransferase family 39 protein [Polyangiaceae bacterium]